MNRKRLILFVLLIFLGVAILWSYNATPRLKTVDTLTYKQGQQATKAKVSARNKAASSEVADNGTILKIGQLDIETTGFKGYRRDIFKPIFADELKLIKQKAAAAKLPPPVMAPPPKAMPPVAPVEQHLVEPESAPLARFTFLGFLKKGSVKTIFLAKDKDILLVKTGDIVAGRYEATAISDQALTLTVTDTGDEIIIPLIENRPLAIAK
jgi:hypothetical protein